MSAFVSMSPASLWPVHRRLYPLYSALAREFVLDAPTCQELDQAEIPSAECLAKAEKWFADLDERVQVHHVRQFAQTSANMTEGAVRDFLGHHLSKNPRAGHDRDKVDFLLVQLFSQYAPANSADNDLGIDSVARALESVLGPPALDVPKFSGQLDVLLQEVNATSTLKAMFTARIIERGREIKATCGDEFFQPAALVAFTRFGFLIRRKFFRLMQQDLNLIFDGLRELEGRGVSTLDCRKAQFSAEEPVVRLRMICQSWRVMFQAEYSSGQPLCLLVDLRTAVDNALAQSSASTVEPTKAAAASAASVHEFEVSSGSSDSEPEQQV